MALEKSEAKLADARHTVAIMRQRHLALFAFLRAKSLNGEALEQFLS